jgi:hypothetical protein
MHPGVLEMLRNYLGRPDREGRNRSMYPDTGGATVGIGCQFETADEALNMRRGGRLEPLPWTRRDGRPWAPGERERVVRSEWRRVADGGDGRAGTDAVVLSGAGIDALFEHKAQENEGILHRVFPDWHGYPADAQLGMLHHSWNKGSARGIEAEEGGRYAAAVRARRWEEAGWQSLWPALRESRRERHISRRNDVMRMFRNAALVDATHGVVPVRMLFFPFDAQPTTDRYLHPAESGLGVR